MKSYLNYTKKSLSLFLAVLMVLSCWVWIAPADVSAEGTIIEEATDEPVGDEETKTPCADDAHNFAVSEDADKTWEATCTKEGQTTEICSECEAEKVTPIPVKEHDYQLQDNGKMVCVCSEEKKTEITFRNSMGGEETVSGVVIGGTCKKIAETTVIENGYTYTFIGWFKDEVLYTKSATLEVVAIDAKETYIAEYVAVKNKYTITYLNEDGGVIASYGYNHGDVINHVAPAIPYKEYEKDMFYGVHYTASWTIDGTVSEDNRAVDNVTYTATYEAKEHNPVKQQVSATCTAPGGFSWICECGYSEIIDDSENSVIPQLPHDVEFVIAETPATIYADGERTVWCKNCGVATEKLDKLVATKMAIQVYDKEGEPADYAKIELFYTVIENKKAKEVKYDADNFAYLTDINGYIEINVPESFEGWVARVYFNGGSYYSNDLVTGDEINIIGEVGRTQIAIKVFDSESNPVQNAEVELFYTETANGETKNVQYTEEDVEYKTDINGYILIDVPTNFSGWNVKIYYSEGVYSGNVDTIKLKNVNIFGEEPEDYVEAGPCSCSCHKRGPVGFIYRIYKYFMEKLSKSEIKCCTNPETKIFLSFLFF